MVTGRPAVFSCAANVLHGHKCIFCGSFQVLHACTGSVYFTDAFHGYQSLKCDWNSLNFMYPQRLNLRASDEDRTTGGMPARDAIAESVRSRVGPS